MAHKRVFGYAEVIFDIGYLCIICCVGIRLLVTGTPALGLLPGAMALVLVGGDAFHLVPRVVAVIKGNEERLKKALGFGKFVASVSMTVFYLLLWQVGRIVCFPGVDTGWTYVVFFLAAIRIALCFFPQNRWQDKKQPLNWAIYRNVPFFLLGLTEIVFFWLYRTNVAALSLLWLAIALSFLFYLPVVIAVNKNPKVGMLMFPKTCAYMWMVIMFLYI